jgi:transcriptional regulator NrdR family protein
MTEEGTPHCPTCRSDDLKVVESKAAVEYEEEIECEACGTRFRRKDAIMGVDPQVVYSI